MRHGVKIVTEEINESNDLGCRKGETPSRFVAVDPAKMFLQGSVFLGLERMTGVQEVDQNSVVRRLAGMQEHQRTTPLWHAGTSIDDGAVAVANPQVGGSSARSVSHT